MRLRTGARRPSFDGEEMRSGLNYPRIMFALTPGGQMKWKPLF